MAGMADRVIHFSDGKAQSIDRNERRVPVSTLKW
jgi:hypothetical protein